MAALPSAGEDVPLVDQGRRSIMLADRTILEGGRAGAVGAPIPA